MGLLCNHRLERLLSKKVLGQADVEQFKAFRNAEIHRLHEFVHEIGIDRKAGQTNDIKDMREYMTPKRRTKNDVTSVCSPRSHGGHP